MKIKHIKAESFKINNWSGGTTTQLFIYPPESIFKEMKFDFRLSKATIEIERSEFTALPGINRTLLVLDGETLLIHKNHHSKKLSKFDTDNFKGEWETNSIGACTDFNLMTNDKITGIVKGQTFLANQKIDVTHNESYNWIIIYVNEGKIKSLIKNHDFEIHTGDLLILEDCGTQTIYFNCLEKSDLVLVKLSE